MCRLPRPAPLPCILSAPHEPLPALPHPGGSHPPVPQSFRSGCSSVAGGRPARAAVRLLGRDGRFPCLPSSWLSARGLHRCSAVSTTLRPERLSSELRKPGGCRCLPFVSSPGALQGRPWALAATSGAVSPPGLLDASLRLGSCPPLISPVSCFQRRRTGAVFPLGPFGKWCPEPWLPGQPVK